MYRAPRKEVLQLTLFYLLRFKLLLRVFRNTEFKNSLEKRCRVFFFFRFGLPFVLYMERTVTWDALQKEILEKMRHLLRPGVYVQVGIRSVPFYIRCKIIDPLSDPVQKFDGWIDSFVSKVSI